MTYREKFFVAAELLGMLDRVNCPPAAVAGTREYLLDANSGRHAGVFQEFHRHLPDIARKFVAEYDPIAELGRRCHSFSDLFNRGWRARGGERAPWFFLTVGEVRFRGESIYQVTEQKVIETYQRGFQPNEELGVHAWLTFEDMTILDLTIMASLLRRETIGPADYRRQPVVFGRSDTLVDFEYHPYLVDNDFVARVDRYEVRPRASRRA